MSTTIEKKEAKYRIIGLGAEIIFTVALKDVHKYYRDGCVFVEKRSDTQEADQPKSCTVCFKPLFNEYEYAVVPQSMIPIIRETQEDRQEDKIICRDCIIKRMKCDICGKDLSDLQEFKKSRRSTQTYVCRKCAEELLAALKEAGGIL